MQCVPCILHLFYFLSTRWTDLLQSCLPFLISSHDTLRRHLAVIVDKTLLKALAELMWYLWKYNSLKHKQHLVLVVGSEWEAMLLPYHWQMVMLYCGNHFETPPWKGEVNILWITECLFKFYVFVNFLYILRRESSTLILYKELSSPIFQSCEWVSESVRHR